MTAAEGYGPNDGVRRDNAPESPWYGTYSVNQGYYGRPYEASDDASCRGPWGASWAVELFSVTGRQVAERIWAARGAVTEVVARHGGRARVRVEFHDDGTMTVSDYDWSRWSETVPEQVREG